MEAGFLTAGKYWLTSPSAFAIASKSNEGCWDSTKAKVVSAPASSWLRTKVRTLSAFLKFDIRASSVGGNGLRGNMAFHIILRPAWHLSKNRCTCCTRSWNFAIVAAFDLFVQKTSLNCDKFVKASTCSWTRLFSSDKFRAMTDKHDKAKFRHQGDILSKSGGDEGLSSTHSLSSMWPSAVHSARIAPLP